MRGDLSTGGKGESSKTLIISFLIVLLWFNDGDSCSSCKFAWDKLCSFSSLLAYAMLDTFIGITARVGRLALIELIVETKPLTFRLLSSLETGFDCCTPFFWSYNRWLTNSKFVCFSVGLICTCIFRSNYLFSKSKDSNSRLEVKVFGTNGDLVIIRYLGFSKFFCWGFIYNKNIQLNKSAGAVAALCLLFFSRQCRPFLFYLHIRRQ